MRKDQSFYPAKHVSAGLACLALSCIALPSALADGTKASKQKGASAPKMGPGRGGLKPQILFMLSPRRLKPTAKGIGALYLSRTYLPIKNSNRPLSSNKPKRKDQSFNPAKHVSAGLACLALSCLVLPWIAASFS